MVTQKNKNNPPFIPRPPQPKNIVDFVVEVFVVTIGTLLIGSVFGIFLIVVFRPESDVGPYLNAITDIMTTIIGALIGYIAGKGSHQMEQEATKLEKEEKDEAT